MLKAISSLYQRPETLPQTLTSYDLLKSLALILMIIDHTGHFFFPEESWFRVFGRFSVPIWFYLIGYAKTRDVPSVFWLGGALVTASGVLAGEFLLPLSILFTLGLARLMIDRVMAGALQSYESFAGMFFLLFFLTFPTMMIFEYGLLGFFFAVFGYMRRHKEGISMKQLALFGFFAAITVFYISISSLMIHPLSQIQFLTLIVGMVFLMALLFFFTPREYPKITEKLGFATKPLMIMGRHTLFIYVAHIIVFRGIVLFGDDPRFGFLDFDLMPAAYMSAILAIIG